MLIQSGSAEMATIKGNMQKVNYGSNLKPQKPNSESGKSIQERCRIGMEQSPGI
jgi:hypothetical protein